MRLEPLCCIRFTYPESWARPGRRLVASVIVAAIDAGLGSRAILSALLIVGSCCVVLTGRWVPTGLAGSWVTGLAVIPGLPDGVWGTAVFFTWLGAVAVVALASTAAAAFIQAPWPRAPALSARRRGHGRHEWPHGCHARR